MTLWWGRRLQGGRNSGRVVATRRSGASVTRSASARNSVDRGRVGPVQVLENEHERLRAGRGQGPRDNRGQLAPPPLLWRKLRRAARRQGNFEQRGKQRRCFVGVNLDLPQGDFQLGETLVGGGVCAAEPLSGPFGQRMQRRVLQKLRGVPFAPGVPRLGEARVKLLDEPRLAEARLADDEDELPIACPRPLPAARQEVQFLLAADERRKRPPAASPAAAALADNAEKLDWLADALELASRLAPRR